MKALDGRFIVNTHKGPPKRRHKFLDIYTLSYPLKDIFRLVITLQNVLPEVNARIELTRLERIRITRRQMRHQNGVSPRTIL